ncbi:MAG: sulfotransferase [Cyanobacteria bacterium P01_F01_bin.86]
MFVTDLHVPTFLVGAHRSGTTLLGLMLDSHPELSWFHHFEWAVKYIEPDGTWPTVDKYLEILETERGYQAWGLSVGNEVKSYPDILNGFLRQRRERDGKPFSGATIHTRYQEVYKIWPKAKFIHIVRDPRDVACSILKAGWSGNAWGAAHRWQRTELEWNALCKLLPEEQRLFVTFEELVKTPVDTLKRITEFLGISYTEELFSYTSRTPYSYPDPRMALKWQKNMAAEDIEMIELALGDLLLERGYPQVSGRKEISLFERFNFEFINRWNKFQWRIDRYGWRLWLAQFLARRLGSPKQLKSVLQKVDAIDEDRLRSSEQYVADPNAPLAK